MARATPGWPMVVLSPALASTDWPAKKAISTAGTQAANVTANAMAAFPHRTGSRRGTAANVARIMPLPYSLVISIAPSTPTAIWASWIPDRLTAVGAKLAAAAPCGGRAASSAAYRMPNPAARPMAAAPAHRAEGWVRSLIHSAATTRRWVTRWGWVWAGRRAGWG